MKALLIIPVVALGLHAKSQSAPSISKLRIDTCIYLLGKPNQANALKGNPIYFANDIVVSQAELDIDLVKDYTILRCPESFNKFKHIGSQGAIIVLTKQEFETTTPNKIIQEKKLDGDVIFAINSLFLPDLSLKISLKAIDEIETTFVIDPITKNEKRCVNIWTIPKASREKYFTIIL